MSTTRIRTAVISGCFCYFLMEIKWFISILRIGKRIDISKTDVNNKISSFFEEAVLCGTTIQSRIPYCTATQRYRTVPSRRTSFFPVPYRTGTRRYGTVRYGIGTAYRQSLVSMMWSNLDRWFIYGHLTDINAWNITFSWVLLSSALTVHLRSSFQPCETNVKEQHIRKPYLPCFRSW